MKNPRTPSELKSILLRIIESGKMGLSAPDGTFVPFQTEVLHQAVEEVLRAIEGAYVGESDPTACEMICGALFTFAVEHFVTEANSVTTS